MFWIIVLNMGILCLINIFKEFTLNFYWFLF
jgi:hypothetical protein